jgi:hypothetical protein
MIDLWQVPGYTEIRELGAGAQGRAVLVAHERSGEPYVIKYLTAADPASQRQFQVESATLRQISSPYVAQWHGHLDHGPQSAMLMEAVDGVPLKEILARNGRLSPESSLLVLKGSLLGLQAAHERGIVHRDYKPANVVVQKNGLSKLIDFGVATLTGTRSRSGTPLYMAPEQWLREPAGPSTDVYAATCVFVECVTGKPPFAGTMDAHLSAPIPLEAVPDGLRELVVAGLAKTVEDRPSNAGAFVAELETCAVAAYGADWEQHGLNLLGGLAGSLATMFLLAPAAGSALTAGTAAGGTATTTATTVLTAKATIIVAASVLTVGAAAVTYAANQHSDPKPRPAALSLNLASATITENFAQPHVEIRAAAYLQMKGGDPAIRERVNQALRAPLDRVIKFARTLGPCPGDKNPTWVSSTITQGFTGPALLTARYNFELHNYCAGGGNTIWPEALTVDLRSGTALTGKTLWKPATLTATGLRGLERLVGPLETRCGQGTALQNQPLQADEFSPDTRSGIGTTSVNLFMTAKGADFFRAPNGGEGCGDFTVSFPYAKVRDLLRPEVAALLPA